MAPHESVLGGAESVHVHRRSARPKLGPLAWGVGSRLAWASGLSALLWLAVFLALS
ncbi:MAG TPA: hypothetical protein VM689_10765 [Aliidongia sp.]|nr:hypothetical protein [Aliidongia sp.]